MKLVSLICAFLMPASILAVTIGSDTAVSRNNNLQIVNNGDRVAGFIALAGGMRLSSPIVTAIWDCFFQLSGRLSLSGGTLNLNQDLILHNVSNVTSLGNIFGNGHVFELQVTSTCIPFIDPACSLTQGVTTTVSSNVNDISWTFDSQYIAVGLTDGTLAIYRVDLVGNVSFVTSISLGASVNAVAWKPGSYVLAAGTANQPAANELRTYSFNGASLTLIDSTNAYDATVETIAWRYQGDYLAVGGDFSGNEVAAFPIIGAGTFGPGGFISTPTVFPDALSWQPNGNYFAVGVSSGNKLRIIAFTPGSPPTLTADVSAMGSGGSSNAVFWNPVYQEYIAVGSTGTPRLEVYRFTLGSPNTLVVATTNTAGNVNILSGDWQPHGECMAIGQIAATPNVRSLMFNPVTPSLTSDSSFSFISENIDMVSWSNNGFFLAAGRDTSFTIFESTDLLDFTQCFTFSNLNILLKSNICLDDCCITFTGQSSINGQGNCLSLSPTVTIQIGSNSSLLLENIIVAGIRDANIKCLDNTATLSVKTVDWNQDANFSFAQGHFDVLYDWHMIGKGLSFVYTSTIASTIQSHASLILDEGFTFSYAPGVANNNLLQLSAMAAIELISATLHASNAGLRLINGILKVNGKSYLSNNGASGAQGIRFGNGVSANNNLNVIISPAASLQVLSGFVVYDNV